MEKIIFVSAHPDDFELGMGGTLNRFTKEKKEIYGIICFPFKEERKKETFNSCKLLNIKENNIFFLPEVDKQRNLVSSIDEIFKKINLRNT